jgi:hypothetical protein
VFASGNESDMFPRLCQATTKIAAHSTNPKYHDVHNQLPRIIFLILLHVDDSWMNHSSYSTISMNYPVNH